MAITKRQRQVYDFISRFVAEHQYSPSFEEIGNGLNLNSLATVHKHITNLEKKGLLTRDYNRSRSIDLLPPKGTETSHERKHRVGAAAAGPHRRRPTH
jgi:repressor LexA